jgi:hypothetical protein
MRNNVTITFSQLRKRKNNVTFSIPYFFRGGGWGVGAQELKPIQFSRVQLTKTQSKILRYALGKILKICRVPLELHNRLSTNNEELAILIFKGQ